MIRRGLQRVVCPVIDQEVDEPWGLDGELPHPSPTPARAIPAEELPTLFDEYRQVEGSESSVQKGTGLGLSITKKFAELLGGSVAVESEVGKGSTFTVLVEYQEPT